MFPLFSGHHIGVTWRYTNIAFLYWAVHISAKHFNEYIMTFGETHRPSVYLSSTTSRFLSSFHWMVFNFCVTVKTICCDICKLKQFNIKKLLVTHACLLVLHYMYLHISSFCFSQKQQD